MLELFFNPRSVAIIGVSRTTGEGSFNILENLLNMGYSGRLYPVNPKADEILGVKCYPSVRDLPEVPDQAIVTLPRESVPGAVRDCAAMGVRALVLVTQGFGEADGRGAEIQREIVDIIRRSGMRLMGPNTLGTANIFDRFSSSFMPITRREPLPLSIICQTGFFLALDFSPSVGLGLGVDVGNALDIGFYESLRYLGEDDRVSLIAMHVEGIKDGRLVYDLARQITPRKPVVAIKTGKSAVGAEAAGSHSGSLAGQYQVYQAAFRGAGILQLDDVDDLDDTAKAFLHLPPMKGRRVAVVTTTGGGGIMAADACEKYGLELAKFTEASMARLRTIYPSWMEPGNPLDVWPAAIGKFYAQVFMDIFNVVVEDPNVDAIVAIGGAFPMPALDVGPFLKATAEARRDKPIVWWVYGADAVAVARAAEEGRRTAVYPSPERAIRALGRLNEYYGRIHGRRLEAPALFTDTDRVAVRAILERAAAGGRSAAGDLAGAAGPADGSGAFLGPASFSVLESYRIPVAPWRVVVRKGEAIEAARGMGFPVALKGLARGLVHKTEAGVVRLNLETASAVGTAFLEVVNAARKATGAADGAVVQRYLSGGYEVILGAKRDPAFGPVVLFGLGGVYAEVFKDVAFGLAPLSRGEAEAMVGSIKGLDILRGARGRPPADLEAVVDALLRLSALVTENEDILEVDVNPLLVFPEGQGCRAVDARIKVG